MKKYFLLGLMIAIAPNICFGAGARYTQLVREKQRKMEELEKCMGATNGLKIAGLSTIGLTAVGVAGNVAQAKKLDEYESGIESKQKELEKVNKDIAEKEAEIKKAKEAEEAAAAAAAEAAIQQDILNLLNNDPAYVQAQNEFIESLGEQPEYEDSEQDVEIELIEEEPSDIPVEVVQYAETHQDSISSIDKDKNSKQASPQNNVVKSTNSKNNQTVSSVPGNNSKSGTGDSKTSNVAPKTAPIIADSGTTTGTSKTTTTSTNTATTKPDPCASLRNSGKFKSVTTLSDGRCSVDCGYGKYFDAVHKTCESQYDVPGNTQRSSKGVVNAPAVSGSNTSATNTGATKSTQKQSESKTSDSSVKSSGSQTKPSNTATTSKTDPCASLRESGKFKSVTTMADGRCSVDCGYGKYFDAVHKTCESQYDVPGNTQRSSKGVVNAPAVSGSNTSTTNTGATKSTQKQSENKTSDSSVKSSGSQTKSSNTATTKPDPCASLRNSGKFKSVTTLSDGRCSVDCGYGKYFDAVHKTCESQYDVPGNTQRSSKGVVNAPAVSNK